MTKGPAYGVVTKAPPASTTSGKPGDAVKGASMGGGPSKEEIIAIAVTVVLIAVVFLIAFLIYRFRHRLCKCGKKDKQPEKAQYHAANSKDEDAGYNGEPVGTRTYVV